MPNLPNHRCTGSPTCPAMLPAGVRYCPAHARAYESRRGSSTERGYGARHVRLRRMFEAEIAAGVPTFCSRCGKRIIPGSAWDLDHDDRDRSRYRGPSCEHCNRSAGGQAAHR